MFKYILLCSLLAHTTWAKPVEHQHHVEVAPHVVVVAPQTKVALDSLVPVGTPIIHHPFGRYVAPHEQSVVYVPASAIHHNDVVARSFEGIKGKQLNGLGQLISSGAQNLQGAAEQTSGFLTSSSQYIPSLQTANEALTQGINNYIQDQVQAQQQLQQNQQQLQQQQLLIQQQQKIQQLEQQLQPQKQAQLIAIETPLISAGLSLPTISSAQRLPGSDLLNIVGGAVGSVGSLVPSLLSPLGKSKSLSVYGNEPGHHYFIEQPHHHVVEYVPVLSQVPVTTSTIKARRSIVAADEQEKIYLKEAVEDVKPADDDKKNADKQEETLKEEAQKIKIIEVIKPAEVEKPAATLTSTNNEISPDIFGLTLL